LAGASDGKWILGGQSNTGKLYRSKKVVGFFHQYREKEFEITYLFSLYSCKIHFGLV
jgi:hypothetical protein